jgi:hypothetical protein
MLLDSNGRASDPTGTFFAGVVLSDLGAVSDLEAVVDLEAVIDRADLFDRRCGGAREIMSDEYAGCRRPRCCFRKLVSLSQASFARVIWRSTRSIFRVRFFRLDLMRRGPLQGENNEYFFFFFSFHSRCSYHLHIFTPQILNNLDPIDIGEITDLLSTKFGHGGELIGVS